MQLLRLCSGGPRSPIRPASCAGVAGERLLFLLSLLCACSTSDEQAPSRPPGAENSVERIAEIAASVGGSPELTSEARVDMDALVSRVQPESPLSLLTDPAVQQRLQDVAAQPKPKVPSGKAPPPCPVTNEYELPLVTHWDAVSGGMKYLATDTPQLSCLAATLGPAVSSFLGADFIKDNPLFCDEWPTAPNYEAYWGEDHALYTYSDQFVKGIFDAACGFSGVGVRLLRPDALEGGRIEVASDKVQILHARQISKALASIFLPQGWGGPSSGPYPIFVTGAYDINSNTVGYNGYQMAQVIAEQPAAIGIVWNGGSSANSNSGEARMRRQFDDIVDFAVTQFGADRQRVVITGGSRLGNVALSLAGNPDPHDYTVRYAQVLFPGMPKMLENEHAWAWGSSLSSAFGGVGPYTGKPYAWGYDLAGWRYPDSGPANLRGLDRYAATLEVLYGDSDADRVNAERRPYSDRFVDALLAAQTRVRLEIPSHDFYMENKIQLEYARKLEQREVPVEVRYTLMGGHRDLSGWGPAVAALDAVVAGAAPVIEPGWKMERTRVAEPYARQPLATYRGQLPLTVEHPRYTWRGTATPLFVAAQPGTEFAIGLQRNGRWVHAFLGSVPSGETTVVRFDVPEDAELGWYDVISYVRYPGQADYALVVGTPACETCASDLYIGLQTPRHLKQSLFGALMLLFTPRQFPDFFANSWGVADQRAY